MVVVITEHDLGSKKSAMEWLRRAFTRKDRWDKVFDDYWVKVEMDAFILCPKYTGALSQSIRVVDAEEVEGIRQAPVFGASSQYFSKEVLENNKAIIAGGLEYINPRTNKPVTYGQAVHDGHMSRGGSWVPPNPFLTDAVARNMGYLDMLIQRYIDKEVKGE